MSVNDETEDTRSSREGTVPEFYTDATTFETTPYSVVLNFGVNYSTGPGQTPLTRPVARVYMSPHHAKALTMMLERQITAFEQVVGPIAMSGDLIRQLGLEVAGEGKPK